MLPSERPFAVCRLAVVPLRRSPDLLSEMTSQVRFGEAVQHLSDCQGFWEVRLCADGYQGWVDPRQFSPLQSERPPQATAFSDALADWASCPTERRLLPPGTPLPAWDGQVFWLGAERWQWPGPVHLIPPTPAWTSLLREAARYLHAPYLWGGRSLWGLDCSGLVQTLLRHQGISLPRDCQDQIHCGQLVPHLQHALPGDLAFFESTSCGGPHVGLILGQNQVLHCSASVRVDLLSERGIARLPSGTLSHRLTALRRVATWVPALLLDPPPSGP